MEYNQSEFLIETIVPQDELIISRTDLKGVITYANETFANISGYSVEELVGQTHNIVRHPDMPKRVFKDMWNKLQNQQQWTGVVKNLRKDTGYYWVHATISGVYKEDKLVEYKSIRVPISYEDRLKYQKIYDQYRNIDKENIRRVIYS
ncbi:MAG: PAS domain-containing protein [Arcobacteraceae bacterium]|nr:PAS domain-containing protein [Arcobacteraceae bacterium]